MAPFHIAILETDTPPESISSVHGSYGDVIEKALRRGLSEAGHPLQLQTSKWDVIEAQAYPSLGNVDAVFVTAGSKWHWILCRSEGGLIMGRT